MQSQLIHHAASPQPIDFADFADLPDDGLPARKASPKADRHRRLPIRVGQLKRWIADQYGSHLPDTEDARHDLLPYVHHLVLKRGPERARQEAARLLPELTDAEITAMVTDACWWDDDELAVYLEISYADRTRLKLHTVGAYDCLRAERLKRRKRNRRDADRARRAKAGAKPRQQSSERTKPWEQEGVSRRTWYRRRGTVGTVSRPASLTGGAARVVPNAGTGVSSSHKTETTRAASKVVSGKDAPSQATTDTTRAESLKEAIRGEHVDRPVLNADTDDAANTAIAVITARAAFKPDVEGSPSGLSWSDTAIAVSTMTQEQAADAVEIGDRATRRLGEMMKAQAKLVGKAKGGGPGPGRGKKGVKGKVRGTANPTVSDKPGTLADAGIDKNLAHAADKENLSLTIDLAGANPTSTSDIDTASANDAPAHHFTEADHAARLLYLRRRKAWDLKQRQKAAIVAARLRDGIEIGAGERIVLDRIERERQARFELSQRQQEAQRITTAQSPALQRRHAGLLEAVRQGLVPASVLQGAA